MNQNITIISAYQFSNDSSLISVEIPNSVISICDNAFAYCKQLEIIKFNQLSNDVYLGNDIFLDDRNLKRIIMPKCNVQLRRRILENIKTLDINFNPDKNNMENSLVTELTVDQHDCNIANYCYNCKNLHTVTFADNVSSIADFMFKNCINLTSINWPAGLIEIGQNAFEHCQRLTVIDFPQKLQKIGKKAFSKCSLLSKVKIPDKIKYIGNKAFAACYALTSIDGLDKTSIIIENDSFFGDSQLSIISDKLRNKVIINNTATDKFIRKNMFLDDKQLSHYQIQDGVTSIHKGAFQNCYQLSSIEFNDKLQIIGKNAFTNCINLSSITIPDTVEVIEEYAFYGCVNLKEINIPSNIMHIGVNAFGKCNIKKIKDPYNKLKIFLPRFKNYLQN